MKTILLTATLIFLISCNGVAPDQELKTLIEDYQNFKKQNDSNYPLGDFRESTIEKRASYCKELLAQLKKIDPSSFDEEDTISYSLLEFVLNEVVTKYEFKTHWNPILSDA